MSITDHITRPTLLLDERKCRANIHRMAEKARHSGVIFRPHFKSHGSVAIGEWFRTEGVSAITVSSVNMAGYFANAGWEDVTIAFPVNLLEIGEIDRLAGKIRLNVLVNSPEILPLLEKSLHHRVGIFIEIDTGYHRSGITPGNLELVEAIRNGCIPSSKLDFQGFLSHFGETYQARGSEEIRQIYHQGVDQLHQLHRSLQKRRPGIISVGDTPSCSLLDRFTGVDEIRPGNFLFYDVMQLALGACTAREIALCLAAPVVDLYPDRQEAIVYAGAIHLSKEKLCRNGRDLFGLVVVLSAEGWSDPLEGCMVTQLSQEHGVVRFDRDAADIFRPGSLIGVLPVHACLTAHAMKEYLTLQGHSISQFTGI